MMMRRSGLFYIFLMMAFAGMIFRVFWLSTGENSAMAKRVVKNRRESLALYHTKGLIYDCNLKPLAGNQPCTYLVVDPREFNQENIEALSDICGMEVNQLKEKLRKETPFSVKCGIKPKETFEGTLLFDGSDRYSGVASHFIGYLDSEEKVGLSGVEKEFDAYLSLFSSKVEVDYIPDALNGIIWKEELIKQKEDQSKNGLVLTLDYSLCKALDSSMDQHIKKGAAVVLDCQSGEVKAISSRPYYDEEKIASYLESQEGELINRALMPQVVGSVFKIVVTACALEHGLEGFEYDCEGGIMISGQTIGCHHHAGHGKIGLKEAFAESCNVYFIALGQMLGGETLYKMAERFGFGEKINAIGSLSAAAGNLPEFKSGVSLANLSIGQGDLLASPLQIAKMTAVVANGGFLPDISAYKGIYLDGKIKDKAEEEEPIRILSEENAKLLQEYCIETVESGTGTAAKPAIKSAGGKTSSAETGIIKEGREQLNVYFTGFYPADAPQYVVTVFAEDGISGGKTCGPVFKDICDFIGENFLTL